MECDHKSTAHSDTADEIPITGAEQLRQLVDLCRQQFGRDAPVPHVPLGTLPNESLLVLSLCRLSQTCSLLGDATMARHLYQLLLPYQDRTITLTVGGSERTCAAAYFVGLLAANLADWDAAAAHFDHALQINERLTATYDAAQTRYAYASVLVVRGRSGDWEHARALLSETVNALSAGEADAVAAPLRHSERAPVPPAPPLEADSVVSRRSTPATTAPRYVFRADGDYWTVAYDSKAFHLRDVRGLQYIGCLLRHPHHDLHVLDLVVSGLAIPTRSDRRNLPEDGFSVARLDESLPLLDPRARRAYVVRLRDLRAEHDDATLNNDLGRSAALQREIQFLADQLLAASRPGGRCASTASPVERARISVRNAITGALKAIAPHHGELARHLRNAIRTGTTCCYAPDRQVDWSF